MRLLTTLAITMLYSMTAFASNDSINYIPQIHGVVRGRFEYSTQHGEGRFQIRNARVNIGGNISKAIDYFIQSDLCDRGKMKILDAWGRLKFTDDVSLRAGQFRMPFGVEPFRSPTNYYFANRSFMGKQMCNYRAVGAEVSYAFASTPLKIQAGAFNPTSISDHTGWHKTMAYSGKATYTVRNVEISAGLMSIEPDSVRANLIDGAIVWKCGRWIAAGEYMWEHYTHGNGNAHSYLVMANYSMPVNWWEFNQISLQGRFDGLTKHSSGMLDEEHNLKFDNPARNRITLGATLSYKRNKSVYADLRANYEKYFYHKNADISSDGGDKVVIELVVRF